jgi:hypothetical protein
MSEIFKYNSAFDVAFSIDHNYDNWEDVPTEDLIAGLEKRLQYLKDNPGEAAECFGHCDTYDHF